jgi:hypothetical protein
MSVTGDVNQDGMMMITRCSSTIMELIQRNIMEEMILLMITRLLPLRMPTLEVLIEAVPLKGLASS